MSDIKLSYFDFAGGRGEGCRLALHVAGVPFEDDRIKSPQWAERKPKTPFGGIPTLEVKGKGVLAQSGAILAYIGREHGLHPSDPWEAARHEALLYAIEELRSKVSPTLSIKDPEEKKAAREALATGFIPTWAGNVQAQIGAGPFVAGDTLNVVDLELYVVMNWFISGTVDHIPTTAFDAYPKLMALYQAVKSHAKVAEWTARFS